MSSLQDQLARFGSWLEVEKGYSPHTVTGYLRDALQAQRDGRIPRRRSVGVRPQITTLPEGTNFSATAVISADRRYVRVTPMPLFSGIGEVTTFTFTGDTTGTGTGTGGGGA